MRREMQVSRCWITAISIAWDTTNYWSHVLSLRWGTVFAKVLLLVKFGALRLQQTLDVGQ
jgi:hypothetical protein